jgi:hypothetical protein
VALNVRMSNASKKGFTIGFIDLLIF